MKTTLSLLALTTALGTLMVAPVAARSFAPDLIQSPAATAPDLTAADDLLLFADNDSDDDDDEGEDDDDDDEGDDDHEGCGDDDEGGDDDQPCSDARSPLRSGKTSPPKNGLFGNGAAPKAQVN